MKATYTRPCGCGKRRYRTYGAALGSLLASTRKRGTPLRIYRCPVKDGFHLTSRPTWNPPPNREKETQ